MFCIPDYRDECARGLIYMFSVMIQESMVWPGLDDFLLLPCANDEAVLLESDNSLVYCDLPHGFRILRPSSPVAREFVCPNRHLHHVRSLFLDIAEKAAIRGGGLDRLFMKLAEEASISCTHCRKREQHLRGLTAHFQKKFTEITPACFEIFYRHPIDEPATSLQTVLDTHAVSIQALLAQARSPVLRDHMIRSVFDVVQELAPHVQRAIEMDDDHAVENASIHFRRLLTQKLDSLCSFVKTTSIDFKKWLLVLMYFRSIQKPEVPCKDDNGLSLLKKAIVLLYLFFHKKRNIGSQPLVFVEQRSESDRERIDLDGHVLDRVHPLLRGDLISLS